MTTAVLPPPRIEVTSEDSNRKTGDDEYEDDFDKELDSFIESEEKSDDDRHQDQHTETTLASVVAVPDSSTEKGTREIESSSKEDLVTESSSKEALVIESSSKEDLVTESSKEDLVTERGKEDLAHKTPETHSDSEQEADEYDFTEDQKRAMMEYKLQREEDGFPDEDPPEYDVKDKLIKYNAELAQDETPVESNRESKVVFKEELVDLVAPPPEFPSDDDQTPRTSPFDSQVKTQDVTEPDKDDENSKSSSSESSKNSRQVVVERDGQFSVVNVEELTASERKLHNIESPTGDKNGVKDGKQETNSNNSNVYYESKYPSPPTHARPATANGHIRRKVRPATAPQRPKSAVIQSNMLQNFNYNSPYAMSPNAKEASAQRAKYLMDKKMQDEEEKRREEEKLRSENDKVFQAWLRTKEENRKKEKKKENDENKNETKREKDDTQFSESSEPFQTEDNLAAYKAWLKEKQTQLHREKLLKKREEQERKEGFYLASREECDKAFREWLKKKNQELRKARASEKHRNRTHKATIRRSRKTMALMRAIKQSQSFKYVDYYGYRY